MSLISLPLTVLGASLFSATPEKVTFEDHVKPIFKNHCASCHNPEEKSSGLDLLSYTALMQGGASGAVVEGGNPDASRLFKVMTHAEEPKMPPESDKLPEAELEMVKAWIAGGLLDKADSKKVMSAKPKANIALSSTSTEKPAEVAFPKDLLIEPLIDAERGCAVSSIAASPWAPVVAVAAPKEVLLYHTETLELLGVLPFPEGFPHIVKFSRNGSLLLVGGGRDGQSGLVALYDVGTGERVTTVGDELDAVLAADISSDQQMIALGGPSKLVRIYSTKTGELLHSIKKHTDWVTALEFSPDAVLLASGDRAGGLHVWESYSGQLFYTLNGHKGSITDVSWRADSNVFASSSEDTTVWLWEMFNGTAVKNWAAHGTGVNSVEFARDGRLVTAGRDKVLKTWDGNGAALKQTEGFADITTAVTFTHDGARVIGGDWTGEIRVYKADDVARVGNLSMTPPTIAERISATDKLVAELTPKIEPAKSAYDATVAPLEKATADFEAAKKTLADAQAAQQKSDADVQAAKAAFDQAAQQLMQAQTDHQAKQADAQAKVMALATEKTALDAVLAAKAEAEKTVAVETELVNQLNAVVSNAKQQAQSKGGKVEEAAKLSEQALSQAAAALSASQEILVGKSKEAEDRAAAVAVAEANAKTANDLAAAAGALVNERTGAHQTAQANVTTTEQAAAQAKQVVDQQTANTAAMEQAHAAASKTSTDAKVAFDAVSAELAKAQSDRQKWEAARVRVEWKQLRDVLRQHEQVLAERTESLQESQAEVAKVEQEIAGIEKFITDGPTALSAAQSAIDEAQKQVESALAEIKAAEQVVAGKEAVRVDFETQSAKLKTTLDGDPANESLKGALAKSQEVLALLTQDRDAAQATVTAKNADHQAKVDAKAAAEKAKADLEAKLAEAPKQIDPLKAKVAELSTVVSAKQVEAQSASAEVDKARAATDQVAQHLATLTQAAN